MKRHFYHITEITHRYDRHHFFADKRAANKWLAIEINKREKEEPFPGRHNYDPESRQEKSILRMIAAKQWFSVSKYFRLYIKRVKFTKP